MTHGPPDLDREGEARVAFSVGARTPVSCRDRADDDGGRRYAAGLPMSQPDPDFESTLSQVSTEIEALQSALRAALESVLPASTGARA